jgi:hypothetical protein
MGSPSDQTFRTTDDGDLRGKFGAKCPRRRGAKRGIDTPPAKHVLDGDSGQSQPDALCGGCKIYAAVTSDAESITELRNEL